MKLKSSSTKAKTFSSSIERFSLNKKGSLLFFVIFAGIGSALLIISHAATPTTSIEPETAAISSPAVTGTDSNASGGSYVQFKAVAANCTAGNIMNIVAHEDDDILFMNPDILHDVQVANFCVTTVYLTNGDDNLGNTYALSRETGAKAAYAYMASQPNNWLPDSFNIVDSAGVAHTMSGFTMRGQSRISLIFMRLPDGNVDGSGFSDGGFTSLMKLWLSTIPSMTSTNGDSYTDDTIKDVLTKLMTKFQPNHLNIQDYVGAFGDGDHADHHAGAYYAELASRAYTTPHTLTGYLDYLVASHPANIVGTDLNLKYNTWFSYTPYDSQVCQNMTACSADPNYGNWLQRQYLAGVE